ncbi:hypothetical protein [Companilactobacillus mishanensis]|uniref:hypothetical protein n=1 Tax=Companilactobacillus mishanensis TaxID=2486008 RepID=UPI0012965D7F|nr:hypothetical protein [Companilactobacillus mishanensis]MQS89686.1 hypothetical protein [Companilactobacillus mishanensis]
MGIWGNLSDIIQAITTIAAVVISTIAILQTKNINKRESHLSFEVINRKKDYDKEPDKEKGFDVVCLNSGNAPAILNRNCNEKYIVNDGWKTGHYTQEARNSVIMMPNREKTLLHIEPSFINFADKGVYEICFVDSVDNQKYKYRFVKSYNSLTLAKIS